MGCRYLHPWKMERCTDLAFDRGGGKERREGAWLFQALLLEREVCRLRWEELLFSSSMRVSFSTGEERKKGKGVADAGIREGLTWNWCNRDVGFPPPRAPPGKEKGGVAGYFYSGGFGGGRKREDGS